MVLRFLLVLLLLLPLAGSTPLLSSNASKNFWRNYSPQQKAILQSLAGKLRKSFTDADIDQTEELARDAETKREFSMAAGLLYFLTQMHFNRDRLDSALVSAGKGRQLAWAADDPLIAALCGFGIVRVYHRTGNFELAEVAGHAALIDAQRARYRTAEIRALMGAVYSGRGRRDLSRLQFKLAIRETGRLNEPRLIASLEDLFAVQLLNWDQTEEAAAAIGRAYEIRRRLKVDQAWSYFSLAQIAIRRNQPHEALSWVDKAIAARPSGLMPNWLHYYRAKAMLGLRRQPEALDELRTATEWTARLRLHRPFGDALQTSGEVRDQQIYALYVDSLVAEYLRTSDPGLARESFEAGQANRAVSLVNRLKAGADWQQRLPRRYWQKLAELRKAELSTDGSGQIETAALRIAEVRAEVAELESAAGLEEQAPDLKSRLVPLQKRLAEGELLAAFHFGEEGGVLWLVDDRSLRIRVLLSAKDIKRLADEFKSNLDGGGSGLYQALFSTPETLAPYSSITIVPDDILFEVPFAALRGPDRRYLAETHAIRLSPTANMESRMLAGPTPSGLIGIADPICNMADPRYQGLRRQSASVELPRLAGSVDEVDRCGRLFGSNFQKITGAQVRDLDFSNLFQSSPEVIHFATHVYQPEGRDQSPVLTLGLNTAGEMAALTAADISILVSAPPLVTLSGCGSGRGPLAPGTGLLGLTRAWLMAGSKAVVASHWPVVDDSGELFQDYYRHLLGGRGINTSYSASQALQKAQITMIRKGDWRARPEYWAAYFVIGVI